MSIHSAQARIGESSTIAVDALEGYTHSSFLFLEVPVFRCCLAKWPFV